MKSTRLPKLIKLITRKAYTAVELASLLYCTIRSSRGMIQRLRQSGSVYIFGWKKSGVNSWAAMYRYGIGVDAEKPRPLTSNERVLKFRSKETIDDKTVRLARQRGKRFKPRRDPLVAMFYGNGYSKPDD
jgi:chromosome condensin MukBEF MukE localization factor